jgi:hypothetical protein
MPVDQSSTPGTFQRSRNALDSLDQLMVVDAAIVGSGYGAQLDAALVALERLDLFGAMRGQAILQVDAGKRRWQLAEIGGGRADKAGELTEAPMRGGDRRGVARQDQRQAFGIIAACLDMDQGAFDHARPAALGAATYHVGEIVEREEAFVVGT